MMKPGRVPTTSANFQQRQFMYTMPKTSAFKKVSQVAPLFDLFWPIVSFWDHSVSADFLKWLGS
jgi:hypothetical protein